MKLEFKKSISNKVIIILGAMFVFLFLLGYFLLVGIDKVSNVTPEMFSLAPILLRPSLV